MPSLALKASINYPFIGASGPSPLLNGLLHYWSFDDTIDLDTNQLWYSPKVAGSPYLRHRNGASDDPDDPSKTLNGDILNFGISQGILGNAAYGNVRTQLSGQPAVNNTNCVFTTANNSTTPVNIAALGSVFTLNWWMKFDTTKNTNSCIIRKRIRAVANDNYLEIDTDYNGLAVKFTSPAVSNTAYQDAYILANQGFISLYDNAWRMYSLVCDGSFASFAINADLSSSAEEGINTATIIDTIDPLALPLNINYDMENFEPFALDSSNVYIDEFGIWDRALTNAEVLSLYNNGLARAYPFS
jgi:hypothetical protein